MVPLLLCTLLYILIDKNRYTLHESLYFEHKCNETSTIKFMCIRFIHNVQIPFLLEVLCRYVLLEYIRYNILHTVVVIICLDDTKNKYWWVEHYLQGVLYCHGYQTLLIVCIRELCVTIYETYTYVWY